MSRAVKALVIFCEGVHDIAFVAQVLKHRFDFKTQQLKLSAFPAPFNQLFKRNVEKHAAEDLALDMAKKFFLPDQVLKKNQQMVLLFNSGGETKTDKLRDFLSDLLPLIEDAAVLGNSDDIVNAPYYLFTYDADEAGVVKKVAEAQKNFAQIDDEDFISDQLSQSPQSAHGYIDDNKAVFVWGESLEQGTLEHWIIPMLQHSHQANLDKALATLDDMFRWENTVATQAKRHKAAITLLGQGKKPGSAMSVILAQAKLLNKSAYENSEAVSGFVDFLVGFAGLETKTASNKE
jgi:hypothetical protein